MSRYSLKPLPEYSDIFEVAVGWDPGLDTYFVQVFGTPDASSEPEVRLWRGTSVREIVAVQELLAIAGNYAEVPGALSARLRVGFETHADRANRRNMSMAAAA